ALIYSMQGSLWRQALDGTVAVQLTASSGYDYQPDVAPDGRRVAFTRYDGAAMELYVLDLATGIATALTSDGAVNIEPRWSPDGRRLAFVSTSGTGRFHVRIGEWRPDFTSSAVFEPRKSAIERYYYSEWDHQLSPSWLPDGEGIVYVTNPETPYGSGSVWHYALDGDSAPSLVQREETTWKARPDVAPDGRRIAYASYLGRQWHQLWVTTVAGRAEPFPLTYGDFDITAPRWSPDGQRIAYITNEAGNLGIRVQDWAGGRVTPLVIARREYLNPVGELALNVVDSTGKPLPARVAVRASDGRAYAPASAWLHADDGFDRDVQRIETQYFHTDGNDTLVLPAGAADVTVWRGLEYSIEKRRVDVAAGETTTLDVPLAALAPPDDWRERWQSGDVHVHMNYGGTYRNTPDRLAAQAAAEDLDVVFNLIVNKEQRVPDIAYFSPEPDAASTGDVLIVHAQEFHTSFWGHQGLLGLDSHLLIPDYVAYPYTAAASLYPDNATIAELAREQRAIVGYVHPFLSPPPDPARDARLTNALPVDAALGLVDYYEVVGFAHHRASADVWHRLMNCGIRIAAAGGTDAMANYASLRGPLGVNRTYVHVASKGKTLAARRNAWIDGLRKGRSIATNAPLLGLTVEGRGPGEEVQLPSAGTVRYRGFMRSQIPIDHVEVLLNGRVVDTIELQEERTRADVEGELRIGNSGWLLLRAWNDASHPEIFDFYPYGTTTPVWISVDGRAPTSPADAAYFLAWIARLRTAAGAHPDYNSDEEKQRVLSRLDAATQKFEDCR
ncbi:MAG: CehA/McbA family metallohydrolase, partial [Woeseiaceae bacterium]|nr:CehA/McbA family metallohydrolase [Woeseiaceae bacterium]